MNKNQIIAGNWKMNGTIAEANDFIKKINESKLSKTETQVVICPPFTLLHLFNEQRKNFDIGGQDCSVENNGAHTGSISVAMLKDVGCKYVIVGHSERRAKQYETSYIVNKKAQIAQENGLIPIVCVGETIAEKSDNKTKEVINKQIKFSLPKEITSSNIVIAYEPVWSIGTGNVPTNDDITEVIAEIRKTIATLYTEELSKEIAILYGGSVNAANSKEILALEGVDGALVGGASLKVEEFMGIINNSKKN